MMALQVNNRSACRAQTASRRPVLTVHAKKGFNKDKQQGQAKVNERGKVTSRPGPISEKDRKQRAELAEQQRAAAAATVSQANDVTPGEASSSPVTEVQQQQPMASTSARPVQQETPQVVVDRMFRRILTFTGVPIFVGMALFPAFYYLKVVQHVDYPLWVVLVLQTFTFGGGLAGITYGVLSASWDPTREGSFWGWTEFQANVALLMSQRKQ